MKIFIKAFSLTLLLSLLSIAAMAEGRKDELERLKRATQVFNEIMAIPEKAIPNDLLDRAESVAIVPGLKKC